MTYEILRTRLTELEMTLRRVDLPQFKRDDDGGGDANPAPRLFIDIDLGQLDSTLKKGVWIYLEGAISLQARARATDVHRLRKLLEDAEAANPGQPPDAVHWAEYERLNARSQVIFREFVELIAGLAFRSRSNDPWIFEAVDQLVVEYATAARQNWEPLTVPWVQDAIVRTLARVTRIRFQDWSIWGLPTTAFEFWRVLTESDNPPDQVRDLLDFVLRGSRDLTRLRCAHKVLLADAFATYMMGLSYPSAAIMLRLDPSEKARAYMLFEALRLVGRRPGSAAAGVYDQKYVAPLMTWWEQMAGPEPWPRDRVKRRIEDLARLTLEGIQQLLPSGSYRPDNLLQRIDPAAGIIGNGEEIDANSGVVVAGYSLRDVLNVAWAARVTHPETPPRDIASPAIALCKQVLQPRRGDERGKRPPARTARQAQTS